ncbi:MAG: Ig-like domain-containing protein, partial [Actinomycetota bacterium]|nr:Ig-like domain-containing protein [Actinomycetota bacterium]
RDIQEEPFSSEVGNYGLLRRDGSAKPALGAFGGAAAQSAGACGDFAPPSLNVIAPVEGQQFVDKIDLNASATDGGVGVARISYAYDGGKEIRNFTDALTNGAAVGLAPWQGSGALGLGPHTIEVSALDVNGNVVSRTVRVTKVAPGSLRASLTPTFRLGKRPSCKKRRGVTTCSLKGLLSRGATGRPSLGGKVAVEWQWKNKQRRFRKLAGGLKPASKAFTFKAKLKKKGSWRVRVVYKGVAPYKSATSKYVTFKVR